jgi:hypothetical protein
MTILSVILGIIFALISVGALGLIALFITCDCEAEHEKRKRHENKEDH